jgi:pimeloyl-ACP methyl ester carboxylesterase
MQRRQFLASSVMGLVGGAVAGMAWSRVAAGVAAKGASSAGAGAAVRADHAGLHADLEAARRYERERRFIETPFGRIAYIERGTGPAALFLHGFPLNSFQWRGVIDRLSGERRCLAPDSMGLGRTDVAAGQSLTPASQVEMLAAFLDRLGVRDVELIANDSGGAVAQLFLCRHPQRVRSLLLTNCDVEVDSPPPALDPVIDLARRGLFPDLWLDPWLHHKDIARSPEGLGGMCYSDPAHPSDVALEQYLAPLVASPERKAQVNRYVLGLTPNPLAGIESQLRKCTLPVRIVWGMSDTIFKTRNPDYLAGILPNVTGIRRLESARLFFPEEHPDIIAAEARLLWSAHRG